MEASAATPKGGGPPQAIGANMTMSYPCQNCLELSGLELDNTPKEQKVHDQTLVRGGEGFITDGDAVDLGSGVKWQNVIGDLGQGGREFGQGWNVAVSDGDGHGGAGVGEGEEDVRVGIEYLNAVDGGLRFEKCGDFGRWWEVASDGAVVDTNGFLEVIWCTWRGNDRAQ
ncbi:hypothetical protein FH972_007972 [Carpinus fangiana]|uniref:Uncharacterized protein n=1 Tax=Carpinus fangiana TaxID=176857 RepID=A0A5N6QZI6_9ROSI|nr:hypothetical protein FH972_007972 [Carpinus fangiana]